MKKRELKNLSLNKKLISNFECQTIAGGVGPTKNKTCRGKETCFLCE